ncbi:MAG: guanylate kinase [Leptospiraceae bacterium]|nr:guanylate kinase [Leptospiraceae bacterium]
MSSTNSNLYIISSVAGGGKSTLISLLLEKHPEILFSVSCTSREKRYREVEGKDYHFVDKLEFKELIDSGYFYEWAMVHDNYYGTPKKFILDNLGLGKKIILDIDVQGAAKVKQSLPTSVSIFILPPSTEIWMQRLKNRGTETQDSIEKRIKNGLRELSEKEKFDYRIVNDELEKALARLEEIILDNSK